MLISAPSATVHHIDAGHARGDPIEACASRFDKFVELPERRLVNRRLSLRAGLELGHAPIDPRDWVRAIELRHDAAALLRPCILDGRTSIFAYELLEIRAVWLGVT
jgi:hypothetical protein